MTKLTNRKKNGVMKKINRASRRAEMKHDRELKRIETEFWMSKIPTEYLEKYQIVYHP